MDNILIKLFSSLDFKSLQIFGTYEQVLFLGYGVLGLAFIMLLMGMFKAKPELSWRLLRQFYRIIVIIKDTGDRERFAVKDKKLVHGCYVHKYTKSVYQVIGNNSTYREHSRPLYVFPEKSIFPLYIDNPSLKTPYTNDDKTKDKRFWTPKILGAFVNSIAVKKFVEAHSGKMKIYGFETILLILIIVSIGLNIYALFEMGIFG